MQIKYECITYMLTTKKGGDAYISMKINSHFKYIFKTQTKQTQTKKDEITEESHLSYTTIIIYAFCFLVFILDLRRTKNKYQYKVQINVL